MIAVTKVAVIAGSPPVKIYDSVGPSVVLLRSTGTGVFIGGNNAVSIADGFRLGAEITPLQLRNGDDIWAMATSSAIVSILAQT